MGSGSLVSRRAVHVHRQPGALLKQQNVKRMLAYSSIAHAGYLLVAFTALSAEGIAAASFYAAAYAAMNVGVFAVVSHRRLRATTA